MDNWPPKFRDGSTFSHKSTVVQLRRNFGWTGVEESVAARTLVSPAPKRPLTASTSGAAPQATEQQEVKSSAETHNSAEQKAPSAPVAGAVPRPQPSELGTTSTPRGPTSAAALAEPPAVNESPSAQTINDTVGVTPDLAPAPKSQSKKPRMTSRTASRTDSSRYERSYDRYFDGPRNGYEPRYGYESRYGSRGWAPYY